METIQRVKLVLKLKTLKRGHQQHWAKENNTKRYKMVSQTSKSRTGAMAER